MTFIALFVAFILTCFLGVELINKVPPTLHTPLMSGSNAMSGITIVGALMLTNIYKDELAQATFTKLGIEFDLAAILGCVALVFATINVVGGFMVTDRMLKMFKKGS
jgi:NAD(P) transhydrogenase subunit alpha